MTKFFNKFKKPYFGDIFFVSKNQAVSHRTSYGFLTPCQNLEKTNDQIEQNVRIEGRTDLIL